MNVIVRKRSSVITLVSTSHFELTFVQCELFYDRQTLQNEHDCDNEVDQDRDIKFRETFELPGHESLLHGIFARSIMDFFLIFRRDKLYIEY